MAKHALLSPSSANKWVACAAAPAAELQAEKEVINIYAAEGTAAHFLASECLDQGGFKLGDCSGLVIYINTEGEACWDEPEGGYLFKFHITSDYVRHVDTYLASLQEFVGEDGILMPEQRLSLTPITGEEDAKGTSDAVVIRGTELQIHDLKYGMKAVDAHENRQLLLYAGAALEEYSFMYDIDTITLVIHQPRLYDKPSVHTLNLEEFNLLLEPIKVAAALALKVREAPNPFEFAFAGSHCSDNYCKARLTCPVLLREVENANEEAEQFLGDLAEGFGEATSTEDESAVFLKRLGDLAAKIPMVESWCKDVMSRVTAEILSNGNKVPGFKAVMGKKGNRSWKSEQEFADTIKGMRIKRELVYVEKPVSPSVLDDLKKDGMVSEDHWKRLQKVVTWAEPKPTVAPTSDKRPEVEVKKQTQEELASGFE